MTPNIYMLITKCTAEINSNRVGVKEHVLGLTTCCRFASCRPGPPITCSEPSITAALERPIVTEASDGPRLSNLATDIPFKEFITDPSDICSMGNVLGCPVSYK